MLILGHTGVTLGTAALLSKVTSRKLKVPNRLPRQELKVRNLASEPQAVNSQLSARSSSNFRLDWFTSLGRWIDIRVLLLGSLLPDIIDKPLGIIILKDTLANGRIFAHTLLFLVVISLVGFCLYRSRKQLWLLTLSFGTFMHLVLDKMWLSPETLLWPLYGFFFPKGEVEFFSWLKGLLYALPVDPNLYVPEIIGGLILIWFWLILIRRKKIYTFIRGGNL